MINGNIYNFNLVVGFILLLVVLYILILLFGSNNKDKLVQQK